MNVCSAALVLDRHPEAHAGVSWELFRVRWCRSVYPRESREDLAVQEAEFKQFRSQIFALYDRQAYAEALALIDEKGRSFPDFESDILFWRACLAGRQGDRTGALAALRLAADRGHWYHERMLLDPDLDVVRDSEELVDLRRVFQERYEAAQANAKPARQVWEPKGDPRGLLVALHGAGGSILSEGDFWRQAVELGWRVAMLQSSQVFSSGRYHWLDTAKAIDELRHHLAEIGEASFTVLSGFSMGAGLAIRAAMSRSVPAQGFLVVTPSFRMEQMIPMVRSAPPSLRGYIVVGTEDRSHRPATELAAALQQVGIACDLEEHEGLGHDYPDGFATSLRRGLEFLCS